MEPAQPGRGSVATAPVEVGRGDYLALARQVRDAGLLAPRARYYRWKIAVTAAAYAAGWVAFVTIGDSWWTLAVAAGLAVAFTQVVFIGHDAGHLQISRSRRLNRLVGLAVGNAMTGVSFGWWVPKHNAHHAHPNQVGLDPDIGAGALAFAFTTETSDARRGAGRLLTRWQAWLFFPLLLVEGVGLHLTSLDVFRRRRDRGAVTEMALLVAHVAAYLTVVFWVLPPGRALAFMALQQGLFGLYLGCTFAPNHKGMPILDGETGSFVTRQVLTARNVKGGGLTAFAFGGLNYQIEHHLFPTMPRPNLACAQPLIRAYCHDHGVPYCEDSLIGSYRRVLRHLAAVGAGRPAPATRRSLGSDPGETWRP